MIRSLQYVLKPSTGMKLIPFIHEALEFIKHEGLKSAIIVFNGVYKTITSDDHATVIYNEIINEIY